MVIGCDNLNYDELLRFVNDTDSMIKYVEHLVPKWARHIPGILDNQRFFTAIHLRKVMTIPYHQKMRLVNALVENITISGISDQFITIDNIIESCDKEQLRALVEDLVCKEMT